jgi:hypothetical protein
MESWASHPNLTAVHIHGSKGPNPSATVPVDDMPVLKVRGFSCHPANPSKSGALSGGSCIRRFTNFYCADIILDVSFWAHGSRRVVIRVRVCFAFR